MRTGIIGAGISGVSAGRLLAERGEEAVLFDKNKKPGGLIRCEWADGNLFHVTGGHVFNSKNQDVLDWFWKHFDRETEFLAAKRKAGIFLKGNYYGYPIENYIYQLPPDLVERIVKELLALYKMGYNDPFNYSDFESFLIGNFGKTLYELYFKPYNTKIWRTNLRAVAMEWLEGKLPMPDYEQILRSNILRQPEMQMVHSSFYYPKKEGSQFIIDRLAEGLQIEVDTQVTCLELKNKTWYINEQGPFDRIIYTGDIRLLHSLIKSEDRELMSTLVAVKNLKSNGTSNVLCYTQPTDFSWLYLPDAETRAHRIIYTGNFSESNNGDKNRKTCVVEFSGMVEKSVMNEELKKLPGSLVPIQYHQESNSYVIQDSGTRKLVNNVKELLQPLNFYLTGRFAEWEYYNMDKAIEASKIICDRKVL